MDERKIEQNRDNPEFQEKIKQFSRNKREKVKEDPERKELRNAYQREWNKKKRDKLKDQKAQQSLLLS